MTHADDPLRGDMAKVYSSAESDPPFSSLLQRYGAERDSEIAELVEADAGARLDQGRRVSLQRYIDGVPRLAQMPISLDAAIEYTIRAMTASGMKEDDAAAELARAFPTLRGHIVSARALDEVMCSTRSIRRSTQRRSALPVPCDIGPLVPSGRPRYELRQEIGVGSQGTVYTAVDRQLSERGHAAYVAVMVLEPADSDDAARARQLDEATKARRINHPNVVRVLDRGMTPEGLDFIVYEYVEGSSLGDWYTQNKHELSHLQVADMVAKIARGVQAAHTAGLAHCDLKPDNVLLGRTDQQPKVTDFGIAARLNDADDLYASDTEWPIGNLAFTAPEQYRMEEGANSAPADVYALGGVLYFLLTGRLPNGQTPDEVAARHELPDADRWALLESHLAAANVDADLSAICKRAMSVRAEDRYATADTLANDLEAWQRFEPLPWTRPSARRRLALLRRRQPALLVAIIVLLGLLAGGGLLTGQILGQVEQNNIRRTLAAEMAAQQAKLESDKKAAEFAATGERQLRETTASILNAFLLTFDQKQRAAWRDDWPIILTALESLDGPVVFASGEKGPRKGIDLWSARIEYARNVLEQAEANGDKGSSEVQLWRVTLALWLARTDKCSEAREVLATVRATSAHSLVANDPILAYADQLDACCIVAAAVAAGEVDGLDEAELAGAEKTLSRHAEVFAGWREPSLLHRFVVSKIVDLYSPSLLDDPEKHAAAEKLGKELAALAKRASPAKPAP